MSPLSGLKGKPESSRGWQDLVPLPASPLWDVVPSHLLSWCNHLSNVFLFIPGMLPPQSLAFLSGWGTFPPESSVGHPSNSSDLCFSDHLPGESSLTTPLNMAALTLAPSAPQPPPYFSPQHFSVSDVPYILLFGLFYVSSQQKVSMFTFFLLKKSVCLKFI